MLGTIFYNRSIRKLVSSFGALFSNTTLVRYNHDGTENTRFVVPINFGMKEKYWQALQGDPQNDKKVQITLPTMAFTLTNLEYDAARKQQSTIQNFVVNKESGVTTQYVPVPYNFEFELYIYVRTLEDGFQIIEQIVPFFTPDYTLILNLMPSMDIHKDVPVYLKSLETDISNYEGDREGETRFVQFVLTFTVKGWLYGPSNRGHIIREAITNLYNWKNVDGRYLYLVLQPMGNGTFKPGETVYQGRDHPTASATVLDFDFIRKRLFVDFVDGTFITNEPVYGTDSHATWNLINYEITPQLVEKIVVTVNPEETLLGETFIIGTSHFDANTHTVNPGDKANYRIVKTFYE